MGKVTSKDGTAIGYDRWGSGPALVLVDGALGHREFGTMTALARLLADDFTVYAYDRRGRGGSGDTGPYEVAREVEDLAAVIAEAGGAAFVYGISSGAVLTLRAAAEGLPIRAAVLYEPPFTAATSEPGAAEAYTDRLHALLADGRRADAVAHFLTYIGNPPRMVEAIRRSPAWPVFEAVAPTLAYDNAVVGRGVVPAGQAAVVGVPVLVADGDLSPAGIRQGCAALAKALPDAEYRTLPGQTHQVAPEALAPVLREFFGA